eukprot:11314323-Karenia_brevis.AAC.1
MTQYVLGDALVAKDESATQMSVNDEQRENWTTMDLTDILVELVPAKIIEQLKTEVQQKFVHLMETTMGHCSQQMANNFVQLTKGKPSESRPKVLRDMEAIITKAGGTKKDYAVFMEM